MTKTQANLLKIAERMVEKAKASGFYLKVWQAERVLNQCRKNAGIPMQGWGLPTETLIDSGKKDSKGRAIGFLVCTNTDGKQFCVLVQNTRDGEAFGSSQRSKLVASQEAATRLGNQIAQERITKLK